ncbi:hypothetical protein BCV71DRAFT_189649, partial [Rhizopus microsporus]
WSMNTNTFERYYFKPTAQQSASTSITQAVFSSPENRFTPKAGTGGNQDWFRHGSFQKHDQGLHMVPMIILILCTFSLCSYPSLLGKKMSK